MPPHRCSYHMCKNTSDKKSMFSFPWKDENRLKIWLKNCGNKALANLPPKNLQSRYICIDHIDKKYIRNETGRRKRILKDAVPETFPILLNRPRTPPDLPDFLTPNSDPLREITKTPDIDLKEEDIELIKQQINLPEPLSCILPETPLEQDEKEKVEKEESPKCKRLRTLLGIANGRLMNEKKKNKRLKMKVANIKKMVDLSKHKFRSETSKLLTLMQLRKKKKVWSNEEKQFCLSLYKKSISAYGYMLKMGIVLPSKSTITHWLKDNNEKSSASNVIS
ncbi:uncharacterized protein LOC113519904 isoform X2 [Galleria mellonella]|uniref:Uncharacterized protein LOC113519904 isoform X2 n=1 Tax=Galleria mellonella TaxID=7137 RepID=A0A6J1X4F2_GALME|nr:uncharacterized protein LOC113519904 isoform X2 [Galleria mellonella]